MPRDRRYDFSQESLLKPRLLEKLKTEYRKSAIKNVAPLCDDQLEQVAAAGTPGNPSICPYCHPCGDCEWYQEGCLKHLVKAKGGDPRV